MNIKRVIFIRPGETDWNLSDRWQGWLDVPLNEHGDKQARRLAGFLRNIGLKALYSSDLRRSAQTAQIIGEACGLTPKLDARLRERSIGRWQGMTRDEVQAWFPDQYAAYDADRMTYQIPEGESLSQVQARAVEAFEAILAEDAAETIAIVSHTVTVRVLLMALIEGYDARENRLTNSSVTTLHREDDGAWKIVVANDTQHLDGLYSRFSIEAGDEKK
ncbi:MAG: histidine phosphatase family protein [Anaerolineae bacterium]|jgi:probable phosphoglycerate mutase|nr:histidine phosphatase family protein [Anaerolineae bacterium]